MDLQAFFEAHPRAALAFSGGVDSAYLLWAAKKWANEVRAYYVKTAFQPEFELADAKRLASQLQADLKVLPTAVLDCDAVASNPPDRCYHCKHVIMERILSQARADGFDLLLDGTNASDDAGDRPGMRALRELEVLSPLRLCGLTKAQIRQNSREAGLFTWDKPAYACLATRIPTGTPLTEENLRRTEWAEEQLHQLGFRDFRVRTLGNAARLQLRKEDMERLRTCRAQVEQLLRTRYDGVLLDLEVRHGS